MDSGGLRPSRSASGAGFLKWRNTSTRVASSISEPSGLYRGDSSFGSQAMTCDLRGVRAKIDRANEHALQLQEALGGTFDSVTDCFRSEVDPSGLHHTFWTTTVPEIDPRWSTILGDLLTNYKATLDHLAFQLVKLDRRSPTNHTKFPILKSAYDDEGHVRLANISPGIRDPTILKLLDEVQPYKRGEGFSAIQHQLWGLNRLVNIDKHRLLLVIEAVLDWGQLWWGTGDRAGQPEPWLTQEPVTDNMHVASFTFPHTPPGPEFDPHLALTVRLNEGPQGNRIRTIALRALAGQIEWYIQHRVMMRFTPLFPPDTPGHPGPIGHW